MKSLFVYLPAALAIPVVSVALVACDDGNGYHHHGDDGYDDTPTAPEPPTESDAGTVGATTDGGTTTPVTTTPMLAVIDTGQTLTANPGQGVGIFTEYAAGGNWHIWWTCDTTISQLPCDVSITATATTGSITALDTSGLSPAGQASSTSDTTVAASATTTAEVDSIRFTTDPGATLTLSATIGGLTTGTNANNSFFFFVQDGQINGGYTGQLTNPLQFQGSTP